VRETTAWAKPGSAETVVSGVSEDAGKMREIASGEPGSEGGAGNQTPLDCTPWAWLTQKREPNTPLHESTHQPMLLVRFTGRMRKSRSKVRPLCRSSSRAAKKSTSALFAWLISHQPAVLCSQTKPATSNQPAVLFSQNKPAPDISHRPTEQAEGLQGDQEELPRLRG
jgi:hypothetical protein